MNNTIVRRIAATLAVLVALSSIAMPRSEVFADPAPAQLLAEAVVVSAGHSHTMMILQDGSLWAIGHNNHGQLGDGTSIDRNTPVRITNPDETWLSVSAGTHYYTLAVTTDGRLFGWGRNVDGKAGQDPIRTEIPTPERIGTGTDWKYVSAGNTHSLAMREDGTIWSWGSNSDGRLGQGSNISYSYNPTQIGTDYWTAVSAGGTHSLAIRDNGTLWGWGFNQQGQLGIGPGGSRNASEHVYPGTYWASVAAGSTHTAAIRDDGSLWVWGNNANDRLGLGPGRAGSYNTPQQVESHYDWQSVSSGLLHTTAIRDGGYAWSWGFNQYGQLGNGTTTPHNAPHEVDGAYWVSISSGFHHVVGVKSDGSIWTWGDNTHGQIPGVDPSILINSNPVMVSAAITINQHPYPPTRTFFHGDISGSLTIAATLTTDSALTPVYTWFVYNPINSTTSAALDVNGVHITGTSFQIPTNLTVGAHHFFAIVSASPGASSEMVIPVMSEYAIVVVLDPPPDITTTYPATTDPTTTDPTTTDPTTTEPTTADPTTTEPTTYEPTTTEPTTPPHTPTPPDRCALIRVGFTPATEQSVTIPQGMNASLPVLVNVDVANPGAFTADDQLTFQWLREGVPVGVPMVSPVSAGERSVPLVITNAGPLNNGAHTLRVTLGAYPFECVNISPV
ncbi:MAG: hypothetical protein FWD98_07635, partial [Defluviitaleaceae bacterium]|nr:hypothetical protein [Defluviitaleaceae bacterium]